MTRWAGGCPEMADDGDIESDLAFVPTAKLVEELMSRYEACILVYEDKATKTSTDCCTQLSYDGGMSRAIGMLDRAKGLLDEMCADARKRAREEQGG